MRGLEVGRKCCRLLILSRTRAARAETLIEGLVDGAALGAKHVPAGPAVVSAAQEVELLATVLTERPLLVLYPFGRVLHAGMVSPSPLVMHQNGRKKKVHTAVVVFSA